MTQTLTAVGIFTAIVVLLTCLVLLAKHWLVPMGAVDILINNRRSCSVPAGDKLLWALSEHGIYLPAACGGRGTCGQCRVLINERPRRLLPTEAVHINRRDAAAGYRLACMLTVHDALSVKVPEDVLEVRRWLCTVASSRSLSTFLKELVLELPGDERIVFEAGEYVLLEAPPHRVEFAELEIDPRHRHEWERLNLLSLVSATQDQVVRAYSLVNAPRNDTRIVLLVRLATPPGSAPRGTPPGSASSYIFSLKPGDHVAVSGPFGDFHAQQTNNEMLFIAGGVGIAPIRSIIVDELMRGSTRKMSLWYGVRNLDELCYADEFRALAAEHPNFSFHAAVSDAGAGQETAAFEDLIHNVVYEHCLATHAAPEDVEYYLCGPPLMTTAVMQMLEDLGVDADHIRLDDFGAA